MRITDTSFERQFDRRMFLLASFAMATAAAAETPRLETFTQWLKASRKTRELALKPCVERILAMDTSIRAWVQVLPQRTTGSGPPLVARARQVGMDPEFELRAAARAYRDQVLAWEHEQEQEQPGEPG